MDDYFEVSHNKGVGDDQHGWAADGSRVKVRALLHLLFSCVTLAGRALDVEVWFDGQSRSFGDKWAQGDVIGCCIDMDERTISYSKVVRCGCWCCCTPLVAITRC